MDEIEKIDKYESWVSDNISELETKFIEAYKTKFNDFCEDVFEEE